MTKALRYLYFRETSSDAETLSDALTGKSQHGAGYASQLRSELNQRALKWALNNSLSFEQSLGQQAVVFREGEDGRHGNFFSDSYRCLKNNPDWARRFNKVHTSSRRAFASRDSNYKELDTSTSSDALLMNIFCHPETIDRMQIRLMLGIDVGDEMVFGFKPRIPLHSGRTDTTEVDLRIGNLLIEAKLTEHDFQTTAPRLVERYRDLAEVFVLEKLNAEKSRVQSYQLIRGVLAAFATPSTRFCVLCDARRPDLITSWYKVMSAVRSSELQTRLLLLTWQELAAALPRPLQNFLIEKYGLESYKNNLD